jgi:hypothetical protein
MCTVIVGRVHSTRQTEGRGFAAQKSCEEICSTEKVEKL